MGSKRGLPLYDGLTTLEHFTLSRDLLRSIRRRPVDLLASWQTEDTSTASSPYQVALHLMNEPFFEQLVFVGGIPHAICRCTSIDVVLGHTEQPGEVFDLVSRCDIVHGVGGHEVVISEFEAWSDRLTDQETFSAFL